MNKFAAKIFLYILVPTVFSTAGCRQTEMPATNVSPAQNNEAQISPIRVSETNTDAAEPAIAIDAEGGLYVVYVAHGAEKSTDVFLQKFNLKREMIGGRVRVNPNVGEATAWRGDAPTIAVGADKTVYVGWTKAVKNGAEKGTDLCLSTSRDGGKTFDAPVKVNDDAAPASHGMHSLAIGKNNRIFMAWLDERNVKKTARAENFERQNPTDADFRFVKIHHNSNQTEPANKTAKHETAEPNSEIFFAASTDGGTTFSANAKLSSEVCPCCKTSLLAAPDGKIYASWRQVLAGDFRHIAVASSADAGKTFSAPTVVSDDRWKINACPVSGAALAIGANNQLKVVWFTAGEAGKIGLYEAESNDFAKTFSDRRLISEGEIFGTPMLTANGDDLKIIWNADGEIFQSQLSANRELAKTELIAVGDLPSIAAFGEKTFSAFIKKESDKHAVWLNGF